MPRYIYESPDNGRTVYRRDMDNSSAERELCRTVDDNVHITIHEDGQVEIKL